MPYTRIIFIVKPSSTCLLEKIAQSKIQRKQRDKECGFVGGKKEKKDQVWFYKRLLARVSRPSKKNNRDAIIDMQPGVRQ